MWLRIFALSCYMKILSQSLFCHKCRFANFFRLARMWAVFILYYLKLSLYLLLINLLFVKLFPQGFSLPTNSLQFRFLLNIHHQQRQQNSLLFYRVVLHQILLNPNPCNNLIINFCARKIFLTQHYYCVKNAICGENTEKKFKKILPS